MSNLTLYAGDNLAAVNRWASMPGDERKRRAAEACRDRDIETLSDLAIAHMQLHGKAGSHLSRHSIRSTRTSIRCLLDHWGHVSLLRPQADEAALYVRRLESAGLSPGSISVRLAGARALYRALRWTGAIDADPLADARPARDPTPAWERRQPYPESDIERLLTIAGAEDRVLILLAGHGGLRISECLDLHWPEVDLAASRIVVASGKGGKRRTVIGSRRLIAALDALPDRDGPVIRSYRSDSQAREHVRRLCLRAGVHYRGIHALRHATGTRVIRRGGTLLDAARMLGHASVSTAEIYAKWADEGLERNVSEW